jgi:hypothetical protein
MSLQSSICFLILKGISDSKVPPLMSRMTFQSFRERTLPLSHDVSFVYLMSFQEVIRMHLHFVP